MRISMNINNQLYTANFFKSEKCFLFNYCLFIYGLTNLAYAAGT